MNNNRQTSIIARLREGAATSATLAAHIGAPVPSIRRNISSLRDQGYNITFADGAYALVEAQAETGLDPLGA